MRNTKALLFHLLLTFTVSLFFAPIISAEDTAVAVTIPAPGGEREVVGTHTSSNDMPYNMALVPKGKVKMGMSKKLVEDLSEGQKAFLDSLARTVPEHTVTLDPFYCDLFEVTNAQWVLYLEKTSQNPSDHIMQFAWKNNTKPPKGQDLYPVRNVSLKEAKAFARWCGKRIPTEQEWTRAAAGDDGRIYAWGDDWNRGKNCTNRRNTLSPVGSYEAGKSPFGMYDMTGSVWEWTVSKFDRYKGYKPPEIKIGRKKIKAEPGFNPSVYVIKGGHYLAGDLANRIPIREPLSLSSNQDSVGFRCVKDVDPGLTAFKYAFDDLDGSCISKLDFNNDKMYSIEHTELTDDDPVMISDFKFLMINPVGKLNTTAAKIVKQSPETPQPIGVLSTNIALEEPNLPPGSYVLAYRNAGLSAADKKAKAKKDEAKKKADEERKKKEAERRKKELEKRKKERGVKEKAKTAEEIMAEKRAKELEAQLKKEEEEFQRREAERQAALAKIGVVTDAKEHVDFPRDKNLIVFMNSNDTIVGYLEITGITEELPEIPNTVNHSPDSGMTHIEMGMKVLPAKIAGFIFDIKLKDNPF